MIKNLTHDATGNPIQRLAIGWKVSIGIPAGEGQNHPKKSDHFHIRSKDQKGDWVDDENFGKELEAIYNPGQKLREFDVVFLSDDIEEIFRTSLGWWSTAERKCTGDGISAIRQITALSKEQAAKYDKGLKAVPWAPCGSECPEYQDGSCKPNGLLTFMFRDRPTLGSVAAFTTTSRESIRRIHSALVQIQSVTGGHLMHIPFRLILRPGTTRYMQNGKMTKGSAFFVNIEVRAEKYKGFIDGLLKESTSYVRTINSQRKLLAEIVDEDEIEVEQEPEAVVAEQMVREFYPEAMAGNPVDTGQGQDFPPPMTEEQRLLNELIASHMQKLNATAAQSAMLYARFGNDDSKVADWLTKFTAGAERIKLDKTKLQEYFARGIANPDGALKFFEGVSTEGNNNKATPPETQPARKRGKPAAKNVPETFVDESADRKAGIPQATEAISSYAEPEPVAGTQPIDWKF